jgi:hypothetical protein
MAILGLVLADIFNYKAVENKVKECKDLWLPITDQGKHRLQWKLDFYMR